MALYKATKDGQVEMTAQEEREMRDDWAKFDSKKDQPKAKTLEDRVAALEEIVLGKK